MTLHGYDQRDDWSEDYVLFPEYLDALARVRAEAWNEALEKAALIAGHSDIPAKYRSKTTRAIRDLKVRS